MPPTVKGTVYSCLTSQEFQTCKCGDRIIDYKQDRNIVGEWANSASLTIRPLSECPDIVGFGLDEWLVRIKPTLKEGHDYWIDWSQD
jgi:hypothetical protein